MMLGYNDIQRLAKEPAVLRAYDKFLSLRDPDYPDMNYIGLNFKDNRISSLKFYFSVYKRIQPVDLEAFLPCSEDFMRYYHLWEPSKKRSGAHTGCAFSVKFKGEAEPETGFHYRLTPGDEAFRAIGEPQTMPFSIADFGSRPGINYEYRADGSSTRRRYYYLEKKEHKDYIARRFDKPFASRCRLCEVTEFDGGAKVILWSPDYIDEYMKRPTYFDSGSRETLLLLKENYGLINAMDGFYEDGGVLSSYFFNTLGVKNGNINEGPQNFHMDTLGLFLD